MYKRYMADPHCLRHADVDLGELTAGSGSPISTATGSPSGSTATAWQLTTKHTRGAPGLPGPHHRDPRRVPQGLHVLAVQVAAGPCRPSGCRRQSAVQRSTEDPGGAQELAVAQQRRGGAGRPQEPDRRVVQGSQQRQTRRPRRHRLSPLEGDALGLAMGHVPEVVDIDGETKPFICIDLIMRFKAAPGSEIFLGDIRRIIYDLKDKRGIQHRPRDDGWLTWCRLPSADRAQAHPHRSDLHRQDHYPVLRPVRRGDRGPHRHPALHDALSWDSPEPIDILFREISQLVEEATRSSIRPRAARTSRTRWPVSVSYLDGFARSSGASGMANAESDMVSTDRTASQAPADEAPRTFDSVRHQGHRCRLRGMTPAPWRPPR